MYEVIIELVDSISRDGQDTPICAVQYKQKKLKSSAQMEFKPFTCSLHTGVQ